MLYRILFTEQAFQISKQQIYRNPRKVGVILFFYLYPNLYKDSSLCLKNFYYSLYRFFSRQYNKETATFNS